MTLESGCWSLDTEMRKQPCRFDGHKIDPQRLDEILNYKFLDYKEKGVAALKQRHLFVLSYFNPAIFNCRHYCLCPVIYLHFLQDARYVIFNSFFRDEQSFTNHTVTLTIC